MPTYEYECKKCGHVFEKFQSMLAKPLRRCPKCGKTVRRLLGSGAGVIFKGSGFYETDYKKKSSSNATKKAPVSDSAASACGSSGTPCAKPKESTACNT